MFSEALTCLLSLFMRLCPTMLWSLAFPLELLIRSFHADCSYSLLMFFLLLFFPFKSLSNPEESQCRWLKDFIFDYGVG